MKKIFFHKILIAILFLSSSNTYNASSLYAGGFIEPKNKIVKKIHKLEKLDDILEEPIKFPNTPEYKAPISEEESNALVEKNLPGSKPLLQIKRGDLELTLGGSAKFESMFAKNIVLLNNSLPDEFGYYKQTLDFTADLVYGERKYGYKATELFVNVRQKNMWGNTGKYVPTISETVKIADSVLGSHSHKNTKPLLWLKDAWMQVSVNSIANLKTENKHFVKLGFFPFYLGRGIAFGPIYGLSKEFLGICTGYQSDQSAPGININGEIIKDQWSYDLYYAKLEEKSSDLKETFNHIKSNHVGRSQTPWRGVDKDNDFFAIRFKIKPLDKDADRGKLEIEPYIFYNYASDRAVEFEADAKSQLGAGGFAMEYKNGNLEWGMDFAHNFGRETLYNIDRNVIQITRKSDGALGDRYSKVKTVSAAGSSAAVTDDIKTAVEANKNNTTNSAFIAQVNGVNLYNAADRFRPSYKNKYAGWMITTDLSYKLEPIDSKVAASYSFASGDSDPHETENSKTYHGFIGLQEGYAGERVPSVIVLDARKIKRPLTLSPDTNREAGDDGSFTDMHVAGLGLKYFPIEHDEGKFYVQSNALLFWKDKRSFAYDQNTMAVSTTQYASRFLGTEWNLRTKYELQNGLYVFGELGVFFPGGFYSDVKGTPLNGDVFSKLDNVDQTGVDSSNYRLSNNTAYLINLGLSYKF